MNKMINTVFFLALVQSCGVTPKDPEPKESGKVNLPAYPSAEADVDKNFGLTASDETQIYDGRFILWSEQATPEDVAAVQKATVSARLAKRDVLLYAAKNLVPAKKEFEKALTTFEERKALLLKAEQEGINSPEKITNARLRWTSWMEETLAHLESSDSYIASQKAVILERWGAYCDGKLWEFATSPLALEKFKIRPTPHIFCESHYSSKGYFSDPKLCANQDDPKSYFSCLWTTGVLLTPQWQAVINDPATAQCAVTQLKKKDVLKDWLDGSVDILSPLEKLLLDQDTRQLFASTVIAGGRMSKTVFSEDAMSLFRQCPTAFEKKGGFDAPSLSKANPQRLLWIVEHQFPGTLTSKEPLIPLRSSEFLAADEKLYRQLTKTSRAMGLSFQKPMWDGKSQGKASVSDVLFNAPAGFLLTNQSRKNETGESLEGNWALLFPQSPGEADPILGEILSEDSPKILKLREELQTAARFLGSKREYYAGIDAELTKLLELEQATTTAGLKAANRPGASAFFSTLKLKLTRQSKIMIIDLAFEKSIYQCVVLETGGQCLEASSSPLKEGFVDLKISRPQWALPKLSSDLKVRFDSEANKLTLDITLNTPELIGFETRIRTSEELAKADSDPLLRFNEISQENLKGRALRIELFGTKLDGILDIFSGQATLSHNFDDEKPLYRGSLSGDRFDQMFRQITL